MEKSDRSAREETPQEGLQSDQQLQKREDPALNVASKFCVTSETQKLMQQAKEFAQKVQTQDRLLKFEDNESPGQECKIFLDDKELEKKTDATIYVGQKDDNSLTTEQDSSQINRTEADSMHEESDVFDEDSALKSHRNTRIQRMIEGPEKFSLVLEQESIQITQQKENKMPCQDGIVDESLQPKFETNLRGQLKEESLEREESLIVLLEDPLPTGKVEANGAVRQEYDKTTENDQHFHDSESDPELEDSHLVCLLTRQLEGVSSFPLSRRVECHRCRHRTRIMHRQRLPPISEEPDLPLATFEEEILVGRNRRKLATRLLTLLPTGTREYVQMVRERYFPPGRQALHEELQKKCVKLFYCLLIYGCLAGAFRYMVDFLENEYSSHDDPVTTPLADFSVDLNIPLTAFNTSVDDSDGDITTTMRSIWT